MRCSESFYRVRRADYFSPNLNCTERRLDATLRRSLDHLANEAIAQHQQALRTSICWPSGHTPLSGHATPPLIFCKFQNIPYYDVAQALAWATYRVGMPEASREISLTTGAPLKRGCVASRGYPRRIAGNNKQLARVHLYLPQSRYQ